MTSPLARVAAPAAFLLAFTVLVLLVRSSVDSGEPAASTDTAPAATGAATTQTEPEPEPEPEPPPAETQPAEPQPEPTYYEIQSGDTLESIASQHGTTVERLLELNPGIDPVALTVGERIRLT